MKTKENEKRNEKKEKELKTKAKKANPSLGIEP